MNAADELLKAFEEGNGPLAFDAGQRLVSAYRSLAVEAAQLRFELNFGGPTCERCEGLRAGPGVIATCYQVRQCNYDNVKEGGSPRQLKVLHRLLDDDKST